MANIVTLTLNPCIDKSISVANMEPDRKLRCSDVIHDPGGGGINIARALRRLDQPAIAICLLGGYYGDYLSQLLRNERVKYNAIQIGGETRENLIVADRSTGLQYKFNMPGPLIKEIEWEKCLKKISALRNVDFLAASGSLPEGIPIDIYARIASIAVKKKIKFIVDSSGEALQHALEEKVYLAKPNLKELAFISGNEGITHEHAKELAKDVLTRYKCKYIVVSEGDRGAIVASSKAVKEVKAIKVNTLSTVGAGDSMLAGIVYGLVHGKNIYQSVKFGVACGTATTMQPGTHLFAVADVQNIYKRMQ